VKDDGEACDASLSITLDGRALFENYNICIGDACGKCYTGAQVSGKLTLAKSDRPPLVDTFAGSIQPPSTISECPRVPRNSPLDKVWPRAVLNGLYDLWGPPLMSVALGDRDEDVRVAAVILMQEEGVDAIPLLVQALEDRSPDVRQRAANALGALGEDASQAVPALVEALDDSSRPVRLAISGALTRITSQDFGQEQSAWQGWLENPEFKPTAVTSWKGIPIMPGAKHPEELGTMLQYTVAASCNEAVAYFQAEMPAAGWSLAETSSPGSFHQKLKFEKGRETAEVNLSPSGPTGGSACSVQIFWRR
jgi:hypothetical protein